MILRYDQGMNTHHEPTDPNRPAVEDIAREVLMRDVEADAIDDRVGYDASSSLYVENGWSAPALARAVIDLTDTVKRVEALADDMDHDAGLLDQTDDPRLHLIAATHHEDATRLRTALNGGNQ